MRRRTWARSALDSEPSSWPCTRTRPAVAWSRPPARLSSVDLPEPEGPMTATISPGWTREVQPAQGVHGGVAAAVDAADVDDLERRLPGRGGGGQVGVHRRAPGFRIEVAGVAGAGSRTRGVAGPGGAGQGGLAVVEPADLGLEAEAHRLQHQRPRDLTRSPLLEAGEVLHGGDGRGALALDDLADVDARHGHGQRELDGQLVAGPVGADDGVGEPAVELVAAGLGDGVAHAALGVLLLRLDQSVALEAGQRRVDLPDVERPGGAGGGVELVTQLVAVHRLPLEQGEQPVFDGHVLSMHTQ